MSQQFCSTPYHQLLLKINAKFIQKFTFFGQPTGCTLAPVNAGIDYYGALQVIPVLFTSVPFSRDYCI